MLNPAPESATHPAQGHRFGTYAGFSVYAWCVLLYTLFVIAFGAWVRITGAGAGCGSHWPTCHGEVIPRAPETKTLIEYTHRVTSGLLGPLALGLVGWSFFGAGRRRAVQAAAVVTLLFIVFEALIGAGLVLGELVADDDSTARAVVIALHLCNTLVLVAAGALTAWLGAGRSFTGGLRGEGRILALSMALVVLVSMTGAVTALGDTLFPVSPTEGEGVLARVKDGLDPSAHFLVRLRSVHPVFAIGVGLLLVWRSMRWVETGQASGATNTGPAAQAVTLARVVYWLTWAQLFCGTLNVFLEAPGWMQITHLLLAEGLWIALVLLFAVGPDNRDAA